MMILAKWWFHPWHVEAQSVLDDFHGYPCDDCDGLGFYFIDGMRQVCICSEPQS